jgi:hypothetical protein
VQKVVAVVWDPQRRMPNQVGRSLRGDCSRAILERGAIALGICVADEDAQVRSPNPFPLFERRAVGLVNAWLDEADGARWLTDVIASHGFEVALYRVQESVYRDYGDNAHAPRRHWPDGQRSPGILAVTFLERPSRLGREEWVRRWHGTMSPVSEAIQPRARYVRNLVLDALTSPAPPFEGIVEEAWPSARHVTNPFLFYGARTPWRLVANVVRILVAVTSFLTLWRIRTVMMSEYFIRTGHDSGPGDGG